MSRPLIGAIGARGRPPGTAGASLTPRPAATRQAREEHPAGPQRRAALFMAAERKKGPAGRRERRRSGQLNQRPAGYRVTTISARAQRTPQRPTGSVAERDSDRGQHATTARGEDTKRRIPRQQVRRTVQGDNAHRAEPLTRPAPIRMQQRPSGTSHRVMRRGTGCPHREAAEGETVVLVSAT